MKWLLLVMLQSKNSHNLLYFVAQSSEMLVERTHTLFFLHLKCKNSGVKLYSAPFALIFPNKIPQKKIIINQENPGNSGRAEEIRG